MEQMLLNARRFNNFVKNKILKKYVKGNSLLDLACGKGGDIHKWISLHIKTVKGYDLDLDSIKEAKKRYNKIKTKKGKFSFYNTDLSKELIEPKMKFDNVTCFFAIHYFFKNEITFMYLISNIINNIKKNGYFMMTTFSEDKLKQIDYKVDTETFKVKPINIKNGIFGNSISVWIKDSVLDKEREEYVVQFKYLVSKLKEYDIELIESGNFKDFYNSKKHKLNKTEKLLSFLNMYSVFKKI